MSIDAIDSGDVGFDYANWLLETGLWDGREVTWENGDDFQHEIEQRIMHALCSENPASLPSQKLMAWLAWMGSSEEDKSLLARDIQALQLTADGVVVQAGFCKSVGKFWDKHQTKILIGIGVVAVVAVVVVVVVTSGGAAAGGAVVAGGAALKALGDQEDKSPAKQKPTAKESSGHKSATNANSFSLEFSRPSPSLEKPLPPCLPIERPGAQPFTPWDPTTYLSFASLEPSTPPNGGISYVEKGVYIGDRYFSHAESVKWVQQHPSETYAKSAELCGIPPLQFEKVGDFSQPFDAEYWERGRFFPSIAIPLSQEAGPTVLPKPTEEGLVALPKCTEEDPVIRSKPAEADKSWLVKAFQTIGRGLCDPELLDPDAPLPSAELSQYYEINASSQKNQKICGINGMNTSLEGMKSHAQYLKQFMPNQQFGWVYNKSHGVFFDMFEIIAFNSLGFSPNTAKALISQWTEFHEANKDNPDAKMLQFCHSQGAFHVRNALMEAPQEIRERLIVVAIAPATIVPKELCFQSYNYASKLDPISRSALARAGFFDSNELGGVAKHLENVMELQKQLILLDPHEDATGIDHDFQSPTFRGPISRRIKVYLKCNGQYKSRSVE